MEIVLVALGFAMILEGIPCFVAPDTLKKGALLILALSPATLRLIGLALMVGGLLTAWMARQWYTG